MGFVRKTFDFIGKHMLLIIPIFLASIVPQLLAFVASGYFSTSVFIRLQDVTLKYIADNTATKGWAEVIGGINGLIYQDFPKFMLMAGVLVVSSILLQIFIYPGVYGAINSGLSDEKLTGGKFAALFYRKTLKYVIYLLCTVLYWFFWIFAAVIILVFAGTIGLAIQSIASFLLLIALAGVLFGYFYLSIIIILWYPAVEVEDLGMEQALRKSIKVVRKILPSILFTYVVAYAINIAILSIFNSMTTNPTAQDVASIFLSILTMFFLMVYQMVIYKSYVNAEKQAYARMIELDALEQKEKAAQEPKKPE
jgi:hypothetical protein